MSDLDDFARTARELSEWCLSRPDDGATEARIALTLLARLYSRALALRLPEETNDDVCGVRADEERCRNVFERAAALPFTYYSSVPSPVLEPGVGPAEGATVGDLADDITDIYRDLSEGLSLYSTGHLAEAEWAFVFSFRSHWGRHAADAIQALHSWLADTGRWRS